MLESDKKVLQQALVEVVKKAFSSPKPDAWQAVKIYGRRIGEERPDWLEEVTVNAEPTPELGVLAKQGDVKAIAPPNKPYANVKSRAYSQPFK